MAIIKCVNIEYDIDTAMQYTGENLPEIQAWLDIYDVKDEGKFLTANYHGVHPYPKVKISKKDWIVQSYGGTLQIYTNSDFRNEFLRFDKPVDKQLKTWYNKNITE